VKNLKLSARVHGVRYPDYALSELKDAGIAYGGWIANFVVPDLFCRYRATVHVPRRPYVAQLKGIPTIRPFEALACAIPLISSYWDDSEALFRPGQDFLVARNGAEMQKHMSDVLNDGGLAVALARSGLETIRARHTCAHRVNELEAIYNTIRPATVATPDMMQEVQA
jgi:spore maturation protein CgeB